MAKELVIDWTDAHTAVLTGRIDEKAVLDDLFKDFGTATVCVDFRGVLSLNSCGIRNWLVALASSPSNFIYRNVPTNIFKTFCMVADLISSRVVIESFFMLYFCPGCDSNEEKLLVVGKDVVVQNGVSTFLAPGNCAACGETLEIDFSMESLVVNFIGNK